MLPSQFTRPSSQPSIRGFTLLELVAVVAIIAIFAALAVPATVNQLRNRRLHEAGRELSMVYRQARMRALGRGSAVLVRYQDNAFIVREAVRTNGSGGCVNVPYNSCLTNTWNDVTEMRQVNQYASLESDVEIELFDTGSTELTTLDICFSPSGRTFQRRIIADGQAFTTLDEAYVVHFTRTSGSSIPRRVVLMPNGTSRLMALGRVTP